MIIRLGSTNPVKLRATEAAFRVFFSDVQVVPVDVESQVDEHPTTLAETVRGARARAQNASGEGDFSVGIEAGLFQSPDLGDRPYLITIACVSNGVDSHIGGSPFFELMDGEILKQAPLEGAIGVLTKRKITREQVTKDAVVMALAPLLAS